MSIFRIKIKIVEKTIFGLPKTRKTLLTLLYVTYAGMALPNPTDEYISKTKSMPTQICYAGGIGACSAECFTQCCDQKCKDRFYDGGFCVKVLPTGLWLCQCSYKC